MLFGPYELEDIEQIEELLKKRSIQYDLLINEEDIERARQEYKDRPPFIGIPGLFWAPQPAQHVRAVYFEIEEEELKKCDDDLVDYGFMDSQAGEAASRDSSGKKAFETRLSGFERLSAMPKWIANLFWLFVFAFVVFMLIRISFY
jgi:hypothetical protein